MGTSYGRQTCNGVIGRERVNHSHSYILKLGVTALPPGGVTAVEEWPLPPPSAGLIFDLLAVKGPVTSAPAKGVTL